MARKDAGMTSAIPENITHWGLKDRLMMSTSRTSDDASSLLSV